MNATPGLRFHPLPTRRSYKPTGSQSARRNARAVQACNDDARRLEFLRALDTSIAPLTDGELVFVTDVLEWAGLKQYHYAMTPMERVTCDGLYATYRQYVLNEEGRK